MKDRLRLRECVLFSVFCVLWLIAASHQLQITAGKVVDVLEDQLMGVDTLYFMQVVNSLRRLKEQDEHFTFDQTYLATIIDKVF